VSKLSCLTEGLSPRDSLIGERDSLGRDEPGEVSASSADRAMWAANPSAFVTHLFQSPSCPYFSGQAMLHQPPEALHAPIRGHPNIAGRFFGVVVNEGTETICQMHPKVRHRGCPP